MLPKTIADSRQNYAKFPKKARYVLKKITKKPRWLLVFVLGRFRVVRFIYSILSRLYWNFPEATSNSNSLFTNLDTNKILKELKENGIFVGISLPPNILKELLQYTNSQYCFAGGRNDVGFKISEKDEVDKIYDRPFYVARYFNVSTSCPAIVKLANDSTLREIAIKYIGRSAKYIGASLYWTFPIKGTSFDSGQQHFSQFHYDLDDYANLRFCFYLTDVTPESGPHICIRGSHIKKSLLHVLKYFSRIETEEKLVKFYGREQFVTLTGEAGFGFIEDTFCFHKGVIPKSQPRLFLQLHFAANNYHNAEYHDYRELNTLKSFRQLPINKTN